MSFWMLTYYRIFLVLLLPFFPFITLYGMYKFGDYSVFAIRDSFYAWCDLFLNPETIHNEEEPDDEFDEPDEHDPRKGRW